MKTLLAETGGGPGPSIQMLRSVKKLCGKKLTARDGEIGNVQDFYFDDQKWVIRYVVAHTGSWLPGRLVLIAPHAFGCFPENGDGMVVNLRREQIQNSPGIESRQPVSRQYEEEYYHYYGWQSYWSGAGMWGTIGFPVAPPPDLKPIKQGRLERSGSNEDLYLRSAKALSGYRIQTDQGVIGHFADFVIDEQSWEIRKLIVDTGNWFSGNEIAITPAQIERISYHESRIFVNVTMDAIREAPEFEALSFG